MPSLFAAPCAPSAQGAEAKLSILDDTLIYCHWWESGKSISTCLFVLCRLLTSTFLLAHLMAQDLIRQAPAMLMRVQSMPVVPRSPSKQPPDMPGGDSSAGRRLGGSLIGSAPSLH